MSSFELNAKIMVNVQKDEDGFFLAAYPPLNVYAQGETEEEAIRNFIETMGMVMDVCYEKGTLESVLKGAGFHPNFCLESPMEVFPAKIVFLAPLSPPISRSPNVRFWNIISS